MKSKEVNGKIGIKHKNSLMTYVSMPTITKINLPIVFMTRFGFGMKASHLKYVENVSKPIHC